MMLHSSEPNEDSAQYSCNLQKCMLHTKDGNSNSNFVLMQLTVFIIDSCFFVVFFLVNFLFRRKPQSKIIVFFEFREDVLRL